MQLPFDTCSQTTTEVCDARSCVAWAQVCGTPMGHSSLAAEALEIEDRTRVELEAAVRERPRVDDDARTRARLFAERDLRLGVVHARAAGGDGAATAGRRRSRARPRRRIRRARSRADLLQAGKQRREDEPTHDAAHDEEASRTGAPRGKFSTDALPSGRMPDSPFAVRPPQALAGHDPAQASTVLGVLAAVLGEDAIFVFASGVRDAKDALDGLLQRRGPAYAAVLQGHATHADDGRVRRLVRRDGARPRAVCRRPRFSP